MDEFLKGGRSTIKRDSKFVYRPSQVWTPHVHGFLKYLRDHGFEFAPYPYEINKDGQEILSYIDGDVYFDDVPIEIQSDEVLVTYAKVIREFHDLGAKYVDNLTGKETWMLSTQTEVETMCHGDLAPYNTVFINNKVAGLIDFDTLHPGSRLWDIAYALYRWIPLMSDESSENFGSEADKRRRIKLFVDCYGNDLIDEEKIFDSVVSRVNYLVEFILKEAEKGNESFRKNIEDGHVEKYLADIEYIKKTWNLKKVLSTVK